MLAPLLAPAATPVCNPTVTTHAHRGILDYTD